MGRSDRTVFAHPRPGCPGSDDGWLPPRPEHRRRRATHRRKVRDRFCSDRSAARKAPARPAASVTPVQPRTRRFDRRTASETGSGWRPRRGPSPAPIDDQRAQLCKLNAPSPGPNASGMDLRIMSTSHRASPPFLQQAGFYYCFPRLRSRRVTDRGPTPRSRPGRSHDQRHRVVEAPRGLISSVTTLSCRQAPAAAVSAWALGDHRSPLSPSPWPCRWPGRTWPRTPVEFSQRSRQAVTCKGLHQC